MKVLIVEDEQPALHNLIDCIAATDKNISIAGTTSSVTETIKWLHSNAAPDIILMDIELSDGNSFNILKEYPVSSPVIFTTAYNKYLTEAFQYNSIDYLLKPIDNEKLGQTLKKYKSLQQHFIHNYSPFLEYLSNPKKAKSRIIVKKGTEFQAVKTEDIAYFFSEHKLVFAVDIENKKYMCEITSLGEIEEIVGRGMFFRVNRKYIVNADNILKFKSIDKSKLSIDLRTAPAEEIIVSQENAPEFKKWINEL